ncbi:hypothetical protein [Pseudothermotoga thermarum]|uniref:Uncharacterized protein n=1 Tax=Pseudothermotoga thermarum DSM 5069 TaxID=688269 RepID=F7YVY6_9THEM|nr:hypothetical protein [Pseudothermotoga thermarum]AEH51815.1 hypothetical protein Theth_1772 [Pseudothermotoga thermarum DSM 5069]
MIARLKVQQLERWLRFSDRVMGSSEYTMGNVYFSYKDGLILRSTDGCLTSWVKVADCQPFHGEIAISTRLLRGFLMGESSQELELELFQDYLIIKSQHEVLRVKIATPKQREAMQPFEEVGETTTKQILKAFDFATASLEEGDMMKIGSLRNQIFLVGSTPTVLNLCQLEANLLKDFCFAMPYASTRRIVKSLDVYSLDEKTILGISQEKFTILTKEFGMQVCGEMDKIDPRLEELAFVKGEEVLPSGFQKFVSKAAVILPKDATLKITKTKKEIRFFASYGTIQYRGFVPCSEGLEFETEVSAHKLRSALSRMSSRLFVHVQDGYVKISDSSNRSVILKSSEG